MKAASSRNAPQPPASLRIDLALWYLRLARSRAVAQAMAGAGQLRINGRRVDRAHQPVCPGDVLTVPLACGTVRVLRISALPQRRGPAPEARAHYEALDAPGESAIAPDRQKPS